MLLLQTLVALLAMVRVGSALNPGYPYREIVAQIHSVHCRAAFCDGTNDVTMWLSNPDPNVFRLLDTYEDKSLNLRAYIGIYSQSGHVVVAFRGTEATSWTNWRSNLQVKRSSFHGTKVHTGFLTSFQRLWPRIKTRFDSLVRDGSARSLSCTGYSMGGALATLMAVQVTTERPDWVSRTFLVTFGQPRVGDKNFARLTNKLPVYWRVVRGADIVPRVPPSLLGFTHGGTEIYYATDFSHKVCAVGVDGSNACTFSEANIKVGDHLDYFNSEFKCEARVTNKYPLPWFVYYDSIDIHPDWPELRDGVTTTNVVVEPVNERLKVSSIVTDVKRVGCNVFNIFRKNKKTCK